jgi:hypothetical protein
MKIAIICSLVGALCGPPAKAQQQDDATFAPYDNRPCSESGSMSTGWTQYKAVDAPGGRCRWVVDEDAMKWAADMERHRQELWWALRSRPLTDAEMADVAQMGVSLTVGAGVSYREEEKMRELSDALLQQFRLKAVAAQVAKQP